MPKIALSIYKLRGPENSGPTAVATATKGKAIHKEDYDEIENYDVIDDDKTEQGWTNISHPSASTDTKIMKRTDTISSGETEHDADKEKNDYEARAEAAVAQASVLQRLQSGERIHLEVILSCFNDTWQQSPLFHATKNNHPRIVCFPSQCPGMLLLLGKHSTSDDDIGHKWMKHCTDIDQVRTQKL